MVRFLPDSWLEGLLRPFVMADPAGSLYFEAAAPDWRFALFIGFMVLALATRRGRLPLTSAQQSALLSMILMFYVWTFAIGNGRYFMAGLLLVGPLLVMAWRLLPGTVAFRALTLVAVVALQVFTLQWQYESNVWGLVRWYQGPGLPLQASALRERPAVFLSIGSQTYSVLVPRFHPGSRWVNIAGQRKITPQTLEYPRLQALLDDPLPKYVVMPLNPEYMSATLQPTAPMLDMIFDSLPVQGWAPAAQPCEVLRSSLALGVLGKLDDAVPRQGFWLCPIQRAEAARPRVAQLRSTASRVSDVFDLVEHRCPRFFPPGQGVETHEDAVATRHYSAADTRLFIDSSGQVYYKYFRSLNATRIGSVEDVRQDRYTIACDKLPGRYQLPWQRD
jgi:hypothetical protein